MKSSPGKIGEMSIPELLGLTLTRKEIEVQDLASYLNVHPTLVSKWRSGKASIPCYHLPEIARYTKEPRFLFLRMEHCMVCTAVREKVAA